MQTARYFRDQAALCLEIARYMSDPHAAEDLRATAAQHFTRATELEKERELIRSPPTVPEK
jgi:hypothetical protein